MGISRVNKGFIVKSYKTNKLLRTKSGKPLIFKSKKSAEKFTENFDKS